MKNRPFLDTNFLTKILNIFMILYQSYSKYFPEYPYVFSSPILSFFAISQEGKEIIVIIIVFQLDIQINLVFFFQDVVKL